MDGAQGSSSNWGYACASFLAGAAVGAGTLYYIKRQKLDTKATKLDAANGLHTVDLITLDGSTTTANNSVMTNHAGGAVSLRNFEDDPILSEHLTRNVQFFGLEAQKQISNAFVVVIGLGGVGSHAAHLLLRSGVGKLRLVDFDQVTLSSLNRHCLATRADVGIPKATCLENHFRDILPEADIESMVTMYDDSTEDQILEGQPDYVLDAIDNIDTKVALLAACHRRGIKVLSSAGAGAKADPTRLKIVDLMESSLDPLARSVRYRLRKDHGIDTGIPVLLSTEKPRCGLIFAPGEESSDVNTTAVNPLDYQVVPNFRIRTIPVLGTVPAIFGLAAASYILCELAEAPFHPEPMFRVQAKALQTQYDRMEERENENYGGTEGVQVDEQEVEVLIRELWQGASARANNSVAAGAQNMKGLTRHLGDLTLTRWNPACSATVDNLVLLTREEADAHDAAVKVPGGFEKLHAEEAEFCNKVEAVLQRAAAQFKFAYY